MAITVVTPLNGGIYRSPQAAKHFAGTEDLLHPLLYRALEEIPVTKCKATYAKRHHLVISAAAFCTPQLGPCMQQVSSHAVLSAAASGGTSALPLAGLFQDLLTSRSPSPIANIHPPLLTSKVCKSQLAGPLHSCYCIILIMSDGLLDCGAIFLHSSTHMVDASTKQCICIACC